jgi:hypothetical protein
MTPDEREERDWLMTHRGFKHVTALLDEIVDRIEKEVISYPTTGSAQDAMLNLNNKRHQAIGARAVINSLKARISEIKYVMKEEDRT